MFQELFFKLVPIGAVVVNLLFLCKCLIDLSADGQAGHDQAGISAHNAGKILRIAITCAKQS